MCSLSANVLFLLKSQIDVALRYPALQIVDDSYRLNWELFNSPIPECEIVDSELLYVEAAVYLHRIALSSKTFLTSPEGEEQIKLRILSLTEEKCHCHSIEELFGEFWNASKQKRDYHWKMYFILLSSSAFIERILNDVFCAFSQSEKVVSATSCCKNKHSIRLGCAAASSGSPKHFHDGQGFATWCIFRLLSGVFDPLFE